MIGFSAARYSGSECIGIETVDTDTDPDLSSGILDGSGYDLYFQWMQAMKVLLVHPPIYDFTAYDFWLRPYGMFRVAGCIQHSCNLEYFNFLVSKQRDVWGRGRYDARDVPRPAALADIRRRYRRFGKPREEFREFLGARSFDAVLIQTSMTYWYPGVREVIEDVRDLLPSAKIVVGGVYATLCPSHAQSLGPDLVVRGSDLAPLWKLLSIAPQTGVPYWPAEEAEMGVMKISDGCPFRCTYCSAPLFWPAFSKRPTQDCVDELIRFQRMGARNIAFYDDALLFDAGQVLTPFLESVLPAGMGISFHTPNALNARFLSPDLALLMVRVGFANFFMGLESDSSSWQRSTGGKVSSQEFEAAVGYLRRAGAQSISTYVIAGHPGSEEQEPERSIRFAHQCGTRVILSEFSPIPGTPDGLSSAKWADLSEPLSHNKTAFAIRRLGLEHINRLKELTHSLNAAL